MHTIAIVLCDSDFTCTIKPLLESILRASLHNIKLDENQVKQAVKMGIGYHYYLFQANPPTVESYIRISNYLEKVQVLFDEEAIDFIRNNDHEGGSWYLDLKTRLIISF